MQQKSLAPMGLPPGQAIDRDNALALAGKLRHEPLKRLPELLRIEPAEQPTEGTVAGQAIGKLEETAQEWLLRPREQPHIDRTLPATQHGTQGDHQQLIDVM